MKSIIFLDLQDALLLHKKATTKFNSPFGVRDSKLLESALHQPQIKLFGDYACKNIFEMAATYAYHIIKNHPFFDGNKRTGMLIALVFLENNGIAITTSQENVYNIALDIASSKATKEEIAQFFKKYAIIIKKSAKNKI